MNTVDKNYNWKIFIKNELKKTYFKYLINFIKIEYSNYTCFPKMKDIFNSIKYCPFQKLKVVILGQDPYYNDNQADGLCFSISNGLPLPPSLKNIFIEVNNCFNYKKSITNNGSLIRWAKQGVLLLNSILTVRKGVPTSHRNKGWEIFTDEIIYTISIKKKNIVFLLWGKQASKKENIINKKNNHYVLKSSHPSPFSVNLGFFGCKHFIKTNNFLIKKNKSIINW